MPRAPPAPITLRVGAPGTAPAKVVAAVAGVATVGRGAKEAGARTPAAAPPTPGATVPPGAHSEPDVGVQTPGAAPRLAPDVVQVRAGRRTGPPPAVPPRRPALPPHAPKPTGAVVEAPPDAVAHEGGVAGAVARQVRAPGQVVAAVMLRRPPPVLQEVARPIDGVPVAPARVTPVAPTVPAAHARRVIERRAY